jgi:hypothetical protein
MLYVAIISILISFNFFLGFGTESNCGSCPDGQVYTLLADGSNTCIKNDFISTDYGPFMENCCYIDWDNDRCLECPEGFTVDTERRTGGNFDYLGCKLPELVCGPGFYKKPGVNGAPATCKPCLSKCETCENGKTCTSCKRKESL